MQSTYRLIKGKVKPESLIIETEFGFDIYYKLIPTVYIDAITKFKDNIPDFSTNIEVEFIKLVKHDNVKTQKEITEILKGVSIIPPNLIYDYVLLGFVYADDTDPNNHRFWLDFRDNKNLNVFTYYGDKIEIHCPITTKTWHDEDPNGIWHGRMVLSANKLDSILEPEPGNLIINGKLRSQCKPIKQKNICRPTDIPEKANSLRLRYNIREDIWFCDILDKEDKEIGVIPCKSIICDAIMYGIVFVVGNQYKVSTKINVSDISEIAIAINSLIIRGK